MHVINYTFLQFQITPYADAEQKNFLILGKNLRRDTECVDFKLIGSDGKEFPVHRSLLWKQLELDYFVKLFSVEMNGKDLKWVKFEDIDSETLEIIVDFIYTGATYFDDDPIEQETHKKVLHAANKFGIEDLKLRCSENLINQIKHENVFELLSFAELCNASMLENECLQYIIT